jgi:hypothetical protein
MYVCMCVCVYIYMYIYIYTHIKTTLLQTDVYACMLAYIQVAEKWAKDFAVPAHEVCICMYACMYVCAYVCMDGC